MNALRNLCLAAALASIFAARPSAAELPTPIQEAAKKEGEIVIYGGIPGQAMKPMREVFEKRYGVRITNWRGDSEEVVNRVAAESKTGNSRFDVVIGSDIVMTSPRPPRRLRALQSAGGAELPQTARPARTPHDALARSRFRHQL
jgi:iron(III) transport system substrate-binding protein